MYYPDQAIRKERDKVKKSLCEEHNIKLLYFSDTKSRTPKFVIKDKDKLLKEIYDTYINNT